MTEHDTNVERGLPDVSLTEVTRHEEELSVGAREVDAGSVTARKVTDVEHVTEDVDLAWQDADVERVPAMEGDSGEIETLPDGSVSIPLFEEQLVVTKQVVVRERLVITKGTTVETQRVEADLRTERVELETQGDAVVEDRTAADDAEASNAAGDAIDNNGRR